MDTLNGIIVFHNQQVEPRSHNLQQSSVSFYGGLQLRLLIIACELTFHVVLNTALLTSQTTIIIISYYQLLSVIISYYYYYQYYRPSSELVVSYINYSST